MEVNIYINIFHTGHLKKGNGTYCIVLEYIKESGEPEVREIYQAVTNTSKQRTALRACIAALKRLTKTCFVNLYIDDTYVSQTMIQGWFYKWEFDTWTKKGQPIKNADLWKELFDLLAKHKAEFKYEKINTYTSYMKSNLRKIEITFMEDRNENTM